MSDQKTYCEILYPGSFYAEEEIIEVEFRDPWAIDYKYPKSFAFQFFDQVKQEVEVDGAKRTVFGDRKNLSPRYFPGGELLTKTQVDALGPEYRILRSNMNNDGWGVVVKTRRGNFQPFDKNCEVSMSDQDSNPKQTGHRVTIAKSDCKWCDAGNVAELSPHSKTYIHRRDTLDKPCTNPRCPKCGEVATYQTPDGTYWDSNAHSWKSEKNDHRCCENGMFGQLHDCRKKDKQHATLAEENAQLRKALREISSYDECLCDHSDENCCIKVGEHCDHCLAQTTLAALEQK